MKGLISGQCDENRNVTLSVDIGHLLPSSGDRQGAYCRVAKQYWRAHSCHHQSEAALKATGTTVTDPSSNVSYPRINCDQALASLAIFPTALRRLELLHAIPQHRVPG